MTSRKAKADGPGRPTNQRAAGKVLAKKRGNAYMTRLAQKGGDAVRAKYGPDYFRAISARGVARRRQIRAAGLRALGEVAEK